MNSYYSVASKALENIRRFDLVGFEFYDISEKLTKLIDSGEIFNVDKLECIYNKICAFYENKGIDYKKHLSFNFWREDKVLGVRREIKNAQRLCSYEQRAYQGEIITFILEAIFFIKYLSKDNVELSLIQDKECITDNQCDTALYMNKEGETNFLFTCDAKTGKKISSKERYNKERYAKQVSSKRTMHIQVYLRAFERNAQMEISKCAKDHVNFFRFNTKMFVDFLCFFAQHSDSDTRATIKELAYSVIECVSQTR